MPDEKSLLIDSLRQLRLLERAQDSTLYTGRSTISIWMDKVLSPELLWLFIGSALLFVGGLICAYLLYTRAQRAKRNDSLQAKSLKMAAAALLALASQGGFFILATLTLSNVLPSQFYGQLYWLGWQVSLLWFVFFGFLFALGFVRDKKSYDVYFITTLILLTFCLMIGYNDWSWRQILSLFNASVRYNIRSEMPFSLGEEYLWLKFSKNTYYAMTIHLAAWIVAFSIGGYRIYRRSKAYQDDSARNASFQLSLAMFLIAGLGAMLFALLYGSPKNLFGLNLTASLIALGVLFYGIRAVYRHGRYRRV
ncbi:MAG: hypothetical protein SNJ55_01205 [Chloroherpetonaceae bacterium]